MDQLWNNMKTETSRRRFISNGLSVAGAVAAGAGTLVASSPLLSQEDGDRDRSGSLTHGDAALLRFAAAAEILETDFWVQYNELCGIQDS
jgi:hypothetical protein